MKPRPRQRTAPQSRRPAPKPQASTCTALVLLDKAPLRAAYLKRCRAVIKTYEKNERHMRQFEEIDLPAYNRWLHALLGTSFAEIKAIQQEIAYEEIVRHAVEELRWELRVSRREAYRIFKEQGADGPSAETANASPGADGPHDDTDSPFMGDPPPDERWDDAFDNDRKTFSEEDVPEFLRFLLGLDPTSGPKQSAERLRREEDARCKYRELCRLLHPDAAGEMTERRKTLWLEVQEAYEQRDVDRLDELLARAMLEAGGVKRLDSLSAILKVIRSFERAGRSVRLLLMRAKTAPSWGFSGLSEAKRRRMGEMARKDLQYDLRELRRHRDRLVAWRQRHCEPRPPRPGKESKNVNQVEFVFDA